MTKFLSIVMAATCCISMVYGETSQFDDVNEGGRFITPTDSSNNTRFITPINATPNKQEEPTFQEKSGLFAGLRLGVSAFNMKFRQQIAGKQDSTEATFYGGLNVGYQHFFAPLIGVRGYLSYDYSGERKGVAIAHQTAASGKVENVSFQNIAFNIDLLLNFINKADFTFGIFAGLGFAYSIPGLSNTTTDQLQKQFDYASFNMPVNLGLAATWHTHHKFELGSQIQSLPPTLTTKVGRKQGDLRLNNFYVAYSYIF